MSTSIQNRDALGSHALSVALIGPEEQRRKAVANALSNSQAGSMQEFASYPGLDDVSRLVESRYDAIIVELDSNPEYALDLVEHICGNSPATVMVYSANSDSEMLVRCMRAGAREFLTLPIAPDTIAEALVRASVRRPVAQQPGGKATGKLLMFLGAKGGSGVTTIASNFAVALAQVSDRKIALIDFGLPIGDAGLSLGISPQFSTATALQNFNRLDSNFLSKLLTKHSSGLSVLASPDEYTPIQITTEAVEKLMNIARQDFDYVVVDAGSGLGPAGKSLIEAATIIYFITQVNIAELRNSNRLITQLFASCGHKLEVVLNRFSPRSMGIDEKDIKRALTVPIQWKIPSNYDAILQAQNTANALALEDSTISRVIHQMARMACGLPKDPEKKKGFSLFK